MPASNRVQTYLELAEKLLNRSAESPAFEDSFLQQAKIARRLATVATLPHPCERYLEAAFEAIKKTYVPATYGDMERAGVYIDLCFTYDTAHASGMAA
ncbi:hypothetical protein [Saccharopolyspora sp. NPDC002376]